MNKTLFTAKSMFYEHSYEHYSLVYKSRRGEEINGVYKYYICHYNFSLHNYFCHGNFLMFDCFLCDSRGPVCLHGVMARPLCQVYVTTKPDHNWYVKTMALSAMVAPTAKGATTAMAATHKSFYWLFPDLHIQLVNCTLRFLATPLNCTCGNGDHFS